ncbi:glycosyl transferase [Pedobacter riviphilus]|uniref:Glycosyl transferase n=1 Tax=Pedobacter riviphilus TaxID=2766984 RepID=A0ABX6TIG2_9SPHI|nr:glycosyl transferase [Pedobacter riviphilus]QNR85304.1 glycosyl transferase [Pedobacter riviphilus]
MLRNKRQMVKASYSLPPIVSQVNGFEIYFLTGQEYIYQTLFCAYSLLSVTDIRFQFILVDDGSFHEALVNRIYQQMPGVKLVLKNEIIQNLLRDLPEEKYPYLHHKRKVYPHIKKLTDIHTLPENNYKLVIDSDMLFWNHPSEMISWLKNPAGCIYMLDKVESYGFNRDLMASLCGHQIPEQLNVGVFGIQSNTINWDDLEYWSKTLEETEQESYFLEQALSAMLIANQNPIVLNKNEYIVNPTGLLPCSGKVKLHHYVDLSKSYYFNTAWKKFI